MINARLVITLLTVSSFSMLSFSLESKRDKIKLLEIVISEAISSNLSFFEDELKTYGYILVSVKSKHQLESLPTQVAGHKLIYKSRDEICDLVMANGQNRKFFTIVDSKSKLGGRKYFGLGYWESLKVTENNQTFCTTMVGPMECGGTSRSFWRKYKMDILYDVGYVWTKSKGWTKLEKWKDLN